MSVCSLRERAKLVQISLPPAQTAIVQRPRVAVSYSGSVAVKGSSATPHKNGKATNYVPDQTKPKKKVFQQK